MTEPEETPRARTSSRRRRFVANIGSGLLVLLITGGVTEIAFRQIGPAPRYQVIRDSENVALRRVDGVPVWRVHDSAERENLACLAAHPNALRVYAVGSSITYGSSVEPSQAFPAVMQRAADDSLGVGQVCVLNLGVPGYGFRNKEVALREALERHGRGVALWEVWANDVFDCHFIGDVAYRLPDLRVDGAGNPNPFGLNAALNALLIRSSRTYEYVALDYAERTGDAPERDPSVARRIERVRDATSAANSALLLWFAPPLDQPFSEQVRRGLPVFTANVSRWAVETETPHLDLAEQLVPHDPVDIRADRCCHYNPAGHEVVAPILWRALASRGFVPATMTTPETGG